MQSTFINSPNKLSVAGYSVGLLNLPRTLLIFLLFFLSILLSCSDSSSSDSVSSSSGVAGKPKSEFDKSLPTSAPISNDTSIGERIFSRYRCGACHSFREGQITTGPNLSKIGSKGTQFIRLSIIDPEASISKGFGRGIMPRNYGKVIPPDELKSLVRFLSTLK